jgi:hypothetical protein
MSVRAIPRIGELTVGWTDGDSQIFKDVVANQILNAEEDAE